MSRLLAIAVLAILILVIWLILETRKRSAPIISTQNVSHHARATREIKSRLTLALGHRVSFTERVMLIPGEEHLGVFDVHVDDLNLNFTEAVVDDEIHRKGRDRLVQVTKVHNKNGTWTIRVLQVRKDQEVH